MIFAGPCLFTDLSESQEIFDTAKALHNIGVDYFRCKLWGGGTTPEKYFDGVGEDGLDTFFKIREFMKVGTEIQTPTQFECSWQYDNNGILIPFDYIWIGARNSWNYGLRKEIKEYKIPWILKRAPNMSIEKLCGAHDIDHPTWVMERGVDALYQPDNAPFMPDLKGVIRMKHERPDIFDKIIVDCSHSIFIKNCVADVYKAFKSVGVRHFMFECTLSGKSKTDQGHMLSVKELEDILLDER
jgi:3-deoxy-D-arabino-heptulosonate 7-phosphate (DAHP) synthase